MQYPVPAYTSFTIPTGATTGQRITFNENGNGKILVYDNSGNVVDEIGSSDGHIATFDVTDGRFAELVNGELLIGNIVGGIPDTANAGSFVSLITGLPTIQVQSIVSSPVSGTFSDRARVHVAAGNTGTIPPKVTVQDEAGTTEVAIHTSGPVIKTDATGTDETWQPWNPIANWAVGNTSPGTFEELQYRLDGNDNLIVFGVIHSVIARAAGTYQLNSPNLATKYRPVWPNAVRIPGGEHVDNTDAWKAQVLVTMNSSGALQVTTSAAIAANDNFYLKATIPLGNID